MEVTHLNESGVCFLVKFEKTDYDAKNITDDHFKSYLEREGFRNPGYGFWGCPWYFINIDSMVYIPGRPGVQYAKPIGDCAITEEEFKTIWNIYRNRKVLKQGVSKTK